HSLPGVRCRIVVSLSMGSYRLSRAACGSRRVTFCCLLGSACLFGHSCLGLCVCMAQGGVPVALSIPENVVLTKLDHLANWGRANSLWPMPFGTACCGIELMAVGASRFDIARFGAEVMRFSPRQCDLMIVAGRVAMKMMPVLQRIWLQMPEP